MIKSLKKLETIGSFFTLLKVKYEKNLMLRDYFIPKIRNKTRISIVQNYIEEKNRK